MTSIDALAFARDYLVGAGDIWRTDDGGVGISRLPLWTDAKHLSSPFMLDVTRTTSGVRFEFETDSSSMQLKLRCSQLTFPGAPVRPVVVDLEMDGAVESIVVSPVEARSPFEVTPLHVDAAPTLELSLGAAGVPKQVRIWLPQNSHSEILAVSTDGWLRKLASKEPTWLHYGSSISQASEVNHPSAVWPVVAAKSLGLQLRSLGLGGNALLDPFIADVIVEAAPQVVSLKLGINTVNAASHNARNFPSSVSGLLDGIRAGLPTTPILLITPIFCPPHEEGVGPTVWDLATMKAKASPKPEELFPMALNLRMIREQLRAIFELRSATDPNLFLLEGTELFGAQDAHLLPDDLHPNHEGYQLMAGRFAAHPIIDAWLKHQ